MTDLKKIKILKSPDVTDLAGEKVMIDFDTGKYFMLIGAANDIWDMLYDGITEDSIVSKLMDIYEIDCETCRSGVHSFLLELADKGFIEFL